MRGWPDGSHHEAINKLMTTAHEAFDRAYYQADTSAQLAEHAATTIEALSVVVRLALAQSRDEASR